MKNNKKEEKVPSVAAKSPVAIREEVILKFWEDNKIFEKSLEKRKDAPLYSFYDGPPFATGTPHYGHIVASTMKDVVPRYWAMRGFLVERKWGWDCHGLPIENIAEKELGITHKKEIVKMGVEKFNEFCRSKVLKYVDEWKVVIKRLGRWADMENSYKTMDMDFMESVWWVFKELWDKGLVYEGYRVMHICTRCETTLSQSEVSEGYKLVKDLSVVVKFKITDKNFLNEYCGGIATSFLAWTTTPWSVTTTMGLAIGVDYDYVIVKIKKSAAANVQEGEQFIFVKNRLEFVMKNFTPDQYEIVKELKGRELEHISYIHPFANIYANHPKVKGNPNAYKTHLTDYVSIEDGTGIVTINGAFGDIDMEAAKRLGLPVVVNVNMDGTFMEEMNELAGLNVKPKENTQETDIEIIKYLAHNNYLFAKEKYEHSYPHCWRCDTPLINYATSSWFVNVLKVKARALELAKEINWSPEYIKEGRFGKWLEGARDWSISRQRFWASVIPIWKCKECSEVKVIGSVNEIRGSFGDPNRLFLVRHGEAENNVQRVLSSNLDKNPYHLTEKGKSQVKDTADILKNEKIDMIFCSPFLRTKETAEIIAKELGMEIVFDDRLVEFGQGKFDGKKSIEFDAFFPTWPEEIKNKREEFGVESEEGARKRFSSFLDEINEKYKNKNIVIVSHGDPLQFIYSIIQESNRVTAYKNEWYPKLGSLKIIYSKKIDLHKHVVDKIVLKCAKCNGEMHRVPDVLDTWFDSGSMPYAQLHYPFDNKEKFDKGFPANFIAEGIDQTRAWFYYLHAIATAIKDKPAFKNVIVNGIVLAEDGKKMSKRLKNYPDPTLMFDKYGADALRFYLLSSPVVSAETINFKESDVEELSRGMFRMLWNSYLFFQTYASKSESQKMKIESQSLLDKWILSELNILTKQVNEGMEHYELVKTVRAFPKFIDNFSNWYIRRSRDRFARAENDSDRMNAEATMRNVLVTLAKLLAPFTPFVAEEIYKNLTGEESVHFADYPNADLKMINEDLSEEMERARHGVTLGLSARAKAKIKVRQPLETIYMSELSDELQDLVKDELNVKKVISFDLEKAPVFEDSDDHHWVRETFGLHSIALDIKITDELKEEGIVRDIARHIQTMRKDLGLTKEDLIEVYSEKSGIAAKILENVKWQKYIKEKTITKNITDYKEGEKYDMEKDLEVEGVKIKFGVRKL